MSYIIFAMVAKEIVPRLTGNVLGAINYDFVIAEWEDGGGPPGPTRLIRSC